jgi:hypothetical protein
MQLAYDLAQVRKREGEIDRSPSNGGGNRVQRERMQQAANWRFVASTRDRGGDTPSRPASSAHMGSCGVRAVSVANIRRAAACRPTSAHTSGDAVLRATEVKSISDCCLRTLNQTHQFLDLRCGTPLLLRTCCGHPIDAERQISQIGLCSGCGGISMVALLVSQAMGMPLGLTLTLALSIAEV